MKNVKIFITQEEPDGFIWMLRMSGQTDSMQQNEQRVFEKRFTGFSPLQDATQAAYSLIHEQDFFGDDKET